LAFIFFPGQVIFGPFMEFIDFQSLIHHQGKFNYEIWKKAVFRGVQGIFCGFIALSISVDPKYALTEDFINKPFFYKLAFIIWAVQGTMWTFYTGFCWMEAV